MNQTQKLKSENKAKKSEQTKTKLDVKARDFDAQKMNMIMQLVCW